MAEVDVKDEIMAELETVIDPELGIDIVNLGLVYDVELDEDGIATITMTLTAMGCPLAGQIKQLVENALEDIPGVKGVNVNIVWNPPWTKDKMSRMAKIALGIQ